MVKINVDSRCELVTIAGVDLRSALYDLKALQVDGEAPAVVALAEWEETAPADFNSIVDGLRIAASVEKSRIGRLRCVSLDKKGRGIFEVAARRKDARLFCFHLERPEIIIVCLGPYWKSQGKKKQDKAFDDAAELKEDYLRWRLRTRQR